MHEILLSGIFFTSFFIGTNEENRNDQDLNDKLKISTQFVGKKWKCFVEQVLNEFHFLDPVRHILTQLPEKILKWTFLMQFF